MSRDGATSLTRHWRIMQMLTASQLGVTVSELAREMSVSQKTVRRDLNLLREVGFPLEERTERFGRKSWRIAQKSRTPELSFTFEEALALHLGRRQLDSLAGTLIGSAAHRAFQKIRAALGSRVMDYVDRMATAFHFSWPGASDYSRYGEVLDQLLIGIEDHRVISLTYQSAQAARPENYDIYPYGLTQHQASWYLVGHAPRRGDIRHWKVDRIEAAEATDRKFSVPKGFDLRAHMAKSFGIYGGHEDIVVKIRFCPEVARYIGESRWHESQKLNRQSDGSVVAEFRLSATEEIKKWVLSFGPRAEVLEPRRLRREVAADLRDTMAIYGRDLAEAPASEK